MIHDETRMDTAADQILASALGSLTDVVVVGYDKVGNFYFASSHAMEPETLWLLALAQRKLLSL